MSARSTRAWFLYEQSREELALEEARLALAEDPHDAATHALCTLILDGMDRTDEAHEHVVQAIRNAPDAALSHYARAHNLFTRNRYDEALDSIAEAIRLDVDDVANYRFQSGVYLVKYEYAKALESAERGLEIDGEDIGCLNARARALTGLGRKEEATRFTDSALERAPDDSDTHATQGWAYLHRHDYDQALMHFEEALRLDASNEWAKSGLAEALKAKSVVYRVALRWYLWMSRMPERSRWKIIIGLWVVYFITRRIAAANPAIAPFLAPLLIAYLAFVALTWLATPVYNLILMTSRYGRAALTEEQKCSAVAVGGLLGLSVLSFIGYAYTDGIQGGLTMALPWLLATISANACFYVSEGWPRTFIRWYTAGLLVACVIVFVGPILDAAGVVGLPSGLWLIAFVVAVLGGVASMWFVNRLAEVEPKR